MTTVADTLRKAKNHLSDPTHWAQYGDVVCDFKTMPTCVGLAIQEYTTPEQWVREKGAHKYNPAIKLFCEANDIEDMNVAGWNDDPDRTHDEVMSGFDRAINLAEIRGK